MDENDYYLKSGPLTELSAAIRKEAASIPTVNRMSMNTALNILQYLDGRLEPGTAERQRSAAEILQSGIIAGSIDRMLIFTVFARSKDIPVRWVKAAANGSTDYFLDMKVGIEFNDPGHWIAIYPEHHTFMHGERRYSWNGRVYQPVAAGLDISSTTNPL